MGQVFPALPTKINEYDEHRILPLILLCNYSHNQGTMRGLFVVVHHCQPRHIGNPDKIPHLKQPRRTTMWDLTPHTKPPQPAKRICIQYTQSPIQTHHTSETHLNHVLDAPYPLHRRRRQPNPPGPTRRPHPRCRRGQRQRRRYSSLPNQWRHFQRPRNEPNNAR